MSDSPLDDSPAESQVGLALQSVLFAVLFGTGVIAVTLWGVRALQSSGPPTPPGQFGAPGILLILASVGGPAGAAFAAYSLMSPIKSYYRRGGLAIVAGFATVALTLISAVPIDHFFGPTALLGLGGVCAVACLGLAWRSSRASRRA